MLYRLSLGRGASHSELPRPRAVQSLRSAVFGLRPGNMSPALPPKSSLHKPCPDTTLTHPCNVYHM